MIYSDSVVKSYFKSCGLPQPSTEYRFMDSRKYRFDFAWIPERVALEVEGGIWTRGAHGRGSGIMRDIEKYNLATCNGWRVLRVAPQDLCTQETVELIAATLGVARGGA